MYVPYIKRSPPIGGLGGDEKCYFQFTVISYVLSIFSVFSLSSPPRLRLGRRSATEEYHGMQSQPLPKSLANHSTPTDDRIDGWLTLHTTLRHVIHRYCPSCTSWSLCLRSCLIAPVCIRVNVYSVLCMR